MKIIGTYNIKGGVGKTATTINLTCLSAMEGYKTLIWDLDPQGAASFYYRIKPKVKGGADKLLAERNLDNVIKGTDIPGLDFFSFGSLFKGSLDNKVLNYYPGDSITGTRKRNRR